MLAICDRYTEGCFSLLKEQRVAAAADGCGFQTEHGT